VVKLLVPGVATATSPVHRFTPAVPEELPPEELLEDPPLDELLLLEEPLLLEELLLEELLLEELLLEELLLEELLELGSVSEPVEPPPPHADSSADAVATTIHSSTLSLSKRLSINSPRMCKQCTRVSRQLRYYAIVAV
jgi:hypothetical protein